MEKARRGHTVIYMTEAGELGICFKKPKSLGEILTDCVTFIPFPLVLAKAHICLR